MLNDKTKLDVPRLLETRLLIQANSGGGKSWALRRILEQTAKQCQQIIIDPAERSRSISASCAAMGGSPSRTRSRSRTISCSPDLRSLRSYHKFQSFIFTLKFYSR